MLSKKNSKKTSSKKTSLKKISLKNLEYFNALKAHQEMVEKSGGGINYLFQIIDNNNFNFELQEQKIARLLQEIANLENKLLELVTTYKFKNRFIIIEINKSLFIKKIQKQKFYNFLLFIYNKYSNIVFKSLHIKNFINIKKINLKNTMYILKVIVVISNLIYFINNIQFIKII